VRLYKLFLVAAVTIIIVLFFFPRVAAQASTPLFEEAPEAPIPQMIVQYALSYGVKPSLALAIAKCESQLVATARNKTSTAKGIYQFIDGSWKGYSAIKWGENRDVFSAKNNIELGVWVLSTEGTDPWVSSRDCWE